MTAPAKSAVERIICYAYEDSGLVQEGDTPNSEQIARGMVRLLDIINLWQTQGLKLWLQTDQSVTLVDGQQNYTLMPSGSVNIVKPMRVLQGYYLDSNSVRRPIYPLSWDEWMRLSNITQEGQISQYFVQKLIDRLTVSFWLIPDTTAATGTAHLLIQQQVENFTNLTDEIDFPQEWFIALRWGLADDLCTGQPQAVIDRCSNRANTFRKVLEDWDVEDASTSFQPDSRQGNYGMSSFRA